MPTEDQGLQTQPQAQPQAQTVPDPAHVILSAAQTDDKSKADAWEIYHNHEGKEFEDKLGATSLPQDAKSALWQAKTRAATTKAQTAQQQVAPQQDSVENYLDKTAKANATNPAVAATVKSVYDAGRGVYQAGKGLYHGVMGDEESAEAKGTPTGTVSSPNNPAGVAQYGVTPGNVGYNVGKMGHGAYEFGKEAAKDIAGNMPVAVPNDKGVGIADPKAHTMIAKYITAPSQAERDASQQEMEQYFTSKGPEAAGHAISAFLHGTLGEYVPMIGPLVMSLTDQATKGDIGGALSQVASLYAMEKGGKAVKDGIKDRVSAKVAELSKTPDVKQAEENTAALAKDRDAAKAKLDAAKVRYDQHIASHEQGIESPKSVKSAFDKATADHDEAIAHHELALEREAKMKAAQSTVPQQVGGAVGRTVAKVLPKPEPAPEAPIEAAPVSTNPKTEWVKGKEGSWQEVVKPEYAHGTPDEPALAKLGSRPPTVSPSHATTTIPPEPIAASRTSYGRIALPEGPEQGTMGTPKLLTEGTPEGPKVPEGGLRTIKLLEEKQAVAPKPERGDVKTLTTDKKGNVIDKEDTPEGRVGKLLQDALKPAEKYAGEERREVPRQAPKSAAEVEEAIKNRKPIQTPFDVTQGAMDTIKGDQNMPKHPAEQAAVAPKKEELVPVGEEGREPAKSAAEYHPAVQEQVFHLGNDNLDKLASAHGIDPASPEYSR